MDHLPQREKFVNTKSRCRTLCYLGAAILVVLGLAAAHAAPTLNAKKYTTWSDYAGGPESLQYSALTKIDRTNVSGLQLAWSYMAPGPAGRFSFNPLIVDGVMYVGGKHSAVVALDAATGRQIWSRPMEDTPTNRGFNYWENHDRSDRRLIFAVNNYLQELNAQTGEQINTFGIAGKVDLREGLGRSIESIDTIQSGTPGRVFENLVMLGSATGELYESPPGDIRAYDVLSGKQVWVFHTVPHPGEYGYETWPKDAWKYIGGTNDWGEMSLDVKRGIVYLPLGSPTYDLYGADRTGAGLFGNCLLALDARTGKRLWHFQVVHHDLWDYDLTTGPKLLTIRHDGKMVDVVAQPTKFGFLYVFDRVTGQSLWPVEERAVPQSDMPGEHSWPTQPFPTNPPPYARQKFTVDDINPYVEPEEKERLRNILLNARNEGIFTPQTKDQDQIGVPGENGGANWGSTAADPTTGMLYVRSYDAPTIHKLSLDPGPIQAMEVGPPEQRGHAAYVRNCLPCHGADRARITFPASITEERFLSVLRNGGKEMPPFTERRLPPKVVKYLIAYLRNPAAGESSTDNLEDAANPAPSGPARYFGPFGSVFFANNGLIAMGPPWCEVVAYDLNEGTIKWRFPLGTTPGLAAKGIKNTGSSSLLRNGPVVTAGGLIFIASQADRMIHAYDKDTGKLLWETEIDANPDGIPAVYEVDGREYVAFFAASAQGQAQGPAPTPGSGTDFVFKAAKPGSQGYYVFALPQNKNSIVKID